MKERVDAIIQKDQAEYLLSLEPKRDELLSEIELYAKENGIPISDPEVARFLTILIKASHAINVLEIGTAVGYATVWFARAVAGLGGKVTSVEKDEEKLIKAKNFLSKAGLADKVKLVLADVNDYLISCKETFDFVYIDHEKSLYRKSFDLVLPLVKNFGIITFDNLLWGGRVALDVNDSTTQSIRAFNFYLLHHPQVEASILPLGDGLGVAVKTRPTMRELGGPF